mgnify:FL=1
MSIKTDPPYDRMCPGCHHDAFYDKEAKEWRHVEGRAQVNWRYGSGCNERRKKDRRSVGDKVPVTQSAQAEP